MPLSESAKELKQLLNKMQSARKRNKKQFLADKKRLEHYQQAKLKAASEVNKTFGTLYVGGHDIIPERIVCAAIKIISNDEKLNGLIIPSVRHFDLFANSILDALGYSPSHTPKAVTGFITNKHRFVDRKEGLEIAQKQDQILVSLDSNDVLFSEHIY